MIADDRGPRIADRKKFCERLRSCDRERRRSQTIAEDRTMFYLLRSSAIICEQLRLCDHMETKVLRSAIETYPIVICIPTHDSTLLSNKARIFVCSNRIFVLNMAALNKVALVTRNLWRKLRDMSAFTTVTVRNSKTEAKRLIAGKKSVRNLIYRPRRRRSNSAT